METANDAINWVYSGQFLSGKRHGVGRCEWLEQGKWYDGDWQGGCQHGVGEISSTGPPVADEDVHGLPPPVAKFWRMELGEKQESLANSSVEPSLDTELTYVFLEQTVNETLATQQLAKRQDQGLLDPVRDDSVSVEVKQWGFRFGNPDAWIPGRWGALIVTWIEEDGPLYRWNQTQRRTKGADAYTILPNAFIWKVNGVEGDAYRMADIICGTETTRIALYVRNPPVVRYAGLKKNMWRRKGWWAPSGLEAIGTGQYPRASMHQAPALMDQHRLPSEVDEPSELRDRSQGALALEGPRQAALSNENPQDGGMALLPADMAPPALPPPRNEEMTGQLPHLMNPSVVAVPFRGPPEPGLPALLPSLRAPEAPRPPERILAQVRNLVPEEARTAYIQRSPLPVPPHLPEAPGQPKVNQQVRELGQLESWHYGVQRARDRMVQTQKKIPKPKPYIPRDKVAPLNGNSQPEVEARAPSNQPSSSSTATPGEDMPSVFPSEADATILRQAADGGIVDDVANTSEITAAVAETDAAPLREAGDAGTLDATTAQDLPPPPELPPPPDLPMDDRPDLAGDLPSLPPLSEQPQAVSLEETAALPAADDALQTTGVTPEHKESVPLPGTVDESIFEPDDEQRS
jgi:hypothetical protein